MASTVQTHCIKVAAKAGKIELAVKLALLASTENGNGVFLDNARALTDKAGLNAHQFAGGLSALTASGFYKPESDPFYRGHYGYIKG